jgi:hypothetical protein
MIVIWARLGGLLALIVVGSPTAAWAASGWVAPVTIAQADAANAPSIAIDAAGDAFAVWTQSNGENTIVEAALRPAGGSFAAPTALSAPGADASCPVLAADAAGDVTVAWQRSSGSEKLVEAATRPAGGAFSTPVQLSVSGQEASCPQVTTGEHGEATIAWIEGAEASAVVQAVGRIGTGTFSAPITVSPSAVTALDLAGDVRGDATAAWATKSGVVEYASRPAGGVFGAAVACGNEFNSQVSLAVDSSGAPTLAWVSEDAEHRTRIEVSDVDGTRTVSGTEGSSLQLFVDVSVNERGSAVVTWMSYDYSGPEPESTDLAVEAITRPGPLSGWEQPSVIWRGPYPRNGHALAVLLSGQGAVHSALDVNGNATVGWTSGANTALVSTHASGGSFSSPVTISNPAEGVRGSPQFLQDAAGDTTVFWQAAPEFSTELTVCGCVVESATMPVGGAFGEPVRVSGPGSALAPSATGDGAMDATGDGVVGWTQAEGSQFDVDVAGFEATPPAIGALNVPSTGVVGEQLAFSANPTSIWSALSTTWSWGDGSPESSGASVTHSFSATGTYTVTVRAIDELGNIVSATHTVAIIASTAPARQNGSGAKASSRAHRIASRAIRAVAHFKVGVSAVRSSRSASALHVREIMVLGTAKDEHVFVDCHGCQGASVLGSVLARGRRTVFKPRNLVMRRDSTLVVSVTDTGLDGRFRAYGHFLVTYPRPSHPLLRWTFREQGCLSPNGTKHTACPT